MEESAIFSFNSCSTPASAPALDGKSFFSVATPGRIGAPPWVFAKKCV